MTADARSGPVEEGRWPEELTARVVEPGDRPRVFGYDVQGDLARHYGIVDLFVVALTGELPASAAQARALEIALTFLAPITAGDAPSHAAMLVRLCGAADSAVIGTGGIALGEQARYMVRAHAELLAWLRTRDGAPPAAFREPRSEAVKRLVDRLSEAGWRSPFLEFELTLDATLLGVLSEVGLREPSQLEAAIVWARLPCVIAEGFAVKPGRFRKYPMNLPEYRYEDPT